MTEITIRDEFIKLGQAMKLAGAVESGADAKDVIRTVRLRSTGRLTCGAAASCTPVTNSNIRARSIRSLRDRIGVKC